MPSQKKSSKRLGDLPARSTLIERLAAGKELRKKVPRQSHAGWKEHPRRRDPVDLLVESSRGRIPELLPIRYGRMLQSPFTFYRGAAAIMSADLAHTPISRIYTQLCGDCHLLNFGGFATPERRLILDINDFDETFPGPWEWDLKRLAASFVIACRNSQYSRKVARDAVLSCVRTYRKHMLRFAEMRALEVWYESYDLKTLAENSGGTKVIIRLKKRIAKLETQQVLESDFPKLAEKSQGKSRIRDNPPLIYHPSASLQKEFDQNLKKAFRLYRESLPDDRRVLLDRYELHDIAMKVVGVGSVGTRCGIMLMMAGDKDPLFLQVKEARPSVLESYLGRSPYPNQGQRVVVGQRLMQSASDIFLGWTLGNKGRHFYIRQLRDMKIKPEVEIFLPQGMQTYAKYCGMILARAHAKSGDSGLISGYLGNSERFDEALADFAEAYADQNERDHQALVAAVRNGKVEAYLER